MVIKLPEPVLTLALDNFSKLSAGSDEISAIWNIFTKCKDNLENGHRLENLSWRLWYKSTLGKNIGNLDGSKGNLSRLADPMPSDIPPLRKKISSTTASTNTTTTSTNTTTTSDPPVLYHNQDYSNTNSINNSNTSARSIAAQLDLNHPISPSAAVLLSTSTNDFTSLLASKIPATTLNTADTSLQQDNPTRTASRHQVVGGFTTNAPLEQKPSGLRRQVPSLAVLPTATTATTTATGTATIPPSQQQEHELLQQKHQRLLLQQQQHQHQLQLLQRQQQQQQQPPLYQSQQQQHALNMARQQQYQQYLIQQHILQQQQQLQQQRLLQVSTAAAGPSSSTTTPAAPSAAAASKASSAQKPRFFISEEKKRNAGDGGGGRDVVSTSETSTISYSGSEDGSPHRSSRTQAAAARPSNTDHAQHADDDDDFYSSQDESYDSDSDISLSSDDDDQDSDNHLLSTSTDSKSLFPKQLLPTKRPSLLSVALQRTAFRNSQTALSGLATTSGAPVDTVQLMTPAQQVSISEMVCSELTPSIRAGLVSDHARPFGTTRSGSGVGGNGVVVERGCGIDTRHGDGIPPTTTSFGSASVVRSRGGHDDDDYGYNMQRQQQQQQLKDDDNMIW